MKLKTSVFKDAFVRIASKAVFVRNASTNVSATDV
jgi:hypothetical protein